MLTHPAWSKVSYDTFKQTARASGIEEGFALHVGGGAIGSL